jgi:outer membrane protein
MATQPSKLSLFAASLVMCAIGAPLNAQAYDLWSAYSDAQTNDPTFLSASAQNSIAQAQSRQARAAILPTIKLSGSISSEKYVYLATGSSPQTNPTQATISFNQPLLDMSSLTAFKQVRVNVSSSELKLEQARQDLISRVLNAYFSALLSQGKASIAEVQVEVAAKQLKMAQRNFEVGNTTVIDKYEAETAYHNASAAAITAVSARNNAFAALEDMVGHAINEPLKPLAAPLRLKLPVPGSQAQWVERATQENLAIRIAKLTDEVAQLEIKRRSQQRLPIVNLVANQKWRYSDLNQSTDISSRSTNVGLELSVPLFDGGLISAQTDEARALQYQSMQSIRATTTTVSQATRTAYSQATSGLATIEALQAANAASRASVKSNSIGYNLGMRINIDVLNAQKTDAQTQVNLAEAQYNTIIGNVNLKSAISQLTENDVRYINALLADETSKQTVAPTSPFEPTAINRSNDPKPTLASATPSNASSIPATPLTNQPVEIANTQQTQPDQAPQTNPVTDSATLVKKPLF